MSGARCEKPKNGVIGSSIPVLDAAQKAAGQLRYTDDLKLPRMLYAKLLHSPHAHAYIKEIDTREAEALPGVAAVVTWKDSPQIRYNGNGEDQDKKPTELVFDRTVRYVGDKVAAVAAETAEIAAAALKLIHVEYEMLSASLTPEEALREGAYPIHEGGNVVLRAELSGGDTEAAIAAADQVLEAEYRTQTVCHASIEPHVSIADWDASGHLTVWTPTQDAFGQRSNLCRIFGLPMSRVRVISPAMGGGFGGKIDLVTEPVTALLSRKTGRPVKLTYTRREEFPSARTRHASIVRLRMGVQNDGTVAGADEEMILNAGAQTSATHSVCWASGGKFFKFLKSRHLHFTGTAVYTNTPVASAMRGFGSPQQFFPVSSMLNEIANKCGLDPAEVFLKNLADPYEKACGDGESFGNFRLKDCVRRGMELFGWDAARAEMRESIAENGRYRIGAGMACGSHGTSMFPFMPDVTGIMMKMNEDGTIVFTTGTSDMGNGSVTTQCMMIAEVLGIPLEKIACIKTDTDAAMADLGAYASRGTYTSGHAALKTAELMREKILAVGAALLETEPEQLSLHDNAVYAEDGSGRCVKLEAVAKYAREVRQEDLSCTYMYHSTAGPMSSGAHFVKVRVDMETGEVKPLFYVAVHDVGRVINPMNVSGQLEGGIAMGLGYALCEELRLDETGKCISSSFRTYHVLNAAEMPKLRVEFLESEEETGPFGAKSVGECAVVPVAPAVANAVSNAIGVQIRSLPIRPEDVLACCRRTQK